MTKEELDRLTPEELLVMIMQASAELSKAAGDCHRFGWDLKFGSGTNNEIMIQKKKDLNQVTTAYFLKTRGVS